MQERYYSLTEERIKLTQVALDVGCGILAGSTSALGQQQPLTTLPPGRLVSARSGLLRLSSFAREALSGLRVNDWPESQWQILVSSQSNDSVYSQHELFWIVDQCICVFSLDRPKLFVAASMSKELFTHREWDNFIVIAVDD